MAIIIFIFLIFLSLAIAIKLKYIPCGEKIQLILIFLSIAVSIGFNTGYTFSDYNGESVLRVPLSFIVITSMGITNFNLKKRYDMVEFSIILLLINTLLWCVNVISIVKYFNFIYLYMSILFLYRIIENLEDIKIDFFLNLLSIFAISNGILGIFQYILNMKLLPGVWNESIYFIEETGGMVKRVVGFAGTNNSAGNLGAILFCIILFSCLLRKKKMDFFALVLSGIFSVLTLTRIGYIAIIVQLLIFYCFVRVKSLKGITYKYNLTILVIIVISIILIQYKQDIYQTLFINRGFTSDYRLSQFYFVIKNVIRDNFFIGVGPGQLNQYICDNFSKIEIDLHSQFLNVLAEQGIAMFIIYCLFNITILIRNLRRCKHKLCKNFIIAIFLTFIIVSNYNPNQYYSINNLLYYIIMFIFFKVDLKVSKA